MSARIPTATYRLQFHAGFRFRDALALTDYLDDLGVSHLYASPVFHARPGSLHGYDVADPGAVNPEVGGLEDLETLARALAGRGMSILLDVVPNHMGISGAENAWWKDVLENGRSSPFARYFDVDWSPPKAALDGRVVLPVLGAQFGEVLERGEIRVVSEGGAFEAQYGKMRFPLGPRTWTNLLEPVIERLGAGPDRVELESVAAALRNLPDRDERDSERVRERRRDTEIAKSRLDALYGRAPSVRTEIEAELAAIHGTPGEPRSFDRLEILLDRQAYRLCHWRVAADEINYRRFFDVNELAGIRVEDSEVFEAVHELVFDLVRRGWIAGLRIDHPDGLRDPEAYLRALQQGCANALSAAEPERRPAKPAGRDRERPFYVVVEKILESEERLRSSWPVHGTTGYEFLGWVNDLLLDPSGESAILGHYRRLTGEAPRVEDLLYECKKLILQVSLSSELSMLARRLDRISERNRRTRDFTLRSLEAALAEVIACFPVYRTYLRPGEPPSSEDRGFVEAAAESARRRNPAISRSIFDFVASILLGPEIESLEADERAERGDFVARFQQLTGPVTAKGVEDTALYRYAPLASRNEVGADLSAFALTLPAFHRRMRERRRRWPHALSATSTHDAKRSEDARARLAVLSEIPRDWERAVRRWRERNRTHVQRLAGGPAPDAGEELLLYQTLVAVWPPERMTPEAGDALLERVQSYMRKATREAKVHTSWLDPDERRDRALTEFIARILEDREPGGFVPSLLEFLAPVARAGLWNALAQTAIKLAAPGVPDFYQGTELWNFALVDPDNRRPVDFERRRELLRRLDEERWTERPEAIAAALASPEDGRLKLHLVRRGLGLRRESPELFERGSYRAVRTVGPSRRHVVAFARVHRDRSVLCVATRQTWKLGGGMRAPVGDAVWSGTALAPGLALPAGRWRDVLTGRRHAPGELSDGGLPVGEVFCDLPVALLVSES